MKPRVTHSFSSEWTPLLWFSALFSRTIRILNPVECIYQAKVNSSLKSYEPPQCSLCFNQRQQKFILHALVYCRVPHGSVTPLYALMRHKCKESLRWSTSAPRVSSAFGFTVYLKSQILCKKCMLSSRYCYQVSQIIPFVYKSSYCSSPFCFQL